MLKNIDVRFLMILGIVLAVAVLTGCTQQTSEEAEPVAEQAAEEAAPAVEIDPEALAARLAVFDEKDGTADQVLHKCASCAFMMDGSEDHRLDVAGYQMHFCSDGCKSRFHDKPEEAIMALVLPEEKPES